jgi:hypothetical protein
VLEQHGQHHLVVVDRGRRSAFAISHGLVLEPGHVGAGHREAGHLPVDREHHGRRIDRQGRRRQVPVKT